eukprot:UN23573
MIMLSLGQTTQTKRRRRFFESTAVTEKFESFGGLLIIWSMSMIMTE